MKYYLVQLSYTAEAWKQQLARPLDMERRWQVLDKMLANLGGQMADISYGGGDVTVRGKFASEGKDDLVAILVFRGDKEALAFSMAVSAEPGVRDMRMTPITPMADALKIMQLAADARRRSDYSAPGGDNASWAASKGATRPGRPGAKGG
ncbi:MAG: GYD domain-containing protein [Alphaproteobacteria bacterium]|nr:GYD domain-containing protein [Alphaproteobacteria bacterium]